MRGLRPQNHFSLIGLLLGAWGVALSPSIAQASLNSASPSRSSWSLRESTYATDGAETHSNRLSLGFDTTSYFYTQDSHGHSVFPTLTGEWIVSRHGDTWEGLARLQGALIASDRSSHYVDAPELFVGTTSGEVQVHFGRRLESWSRLDDTWQLGLWQPLFRWDYLNPETVGLAGFFFNRSTESSRFVVFASPIFIPERGQSVEFSDGQVVSSSPWIRPPSSRVTLFGEETTARYQLMMPSTSSLIFHPSFGAHARVGGATGFWAAAGYAYQPINQVLLGYDGYLSLQGTPEARVQLYPRILYHHLVSADFGYAAAANEPLQGWVSVVREDPVKDSVPASWTVQQVAPALAVSPTLSWKFASFHAKPAHMDLSYLRVWGGNAPDTGRDATGGGSYFEPRYPYQSAVRGSFETPLPGSIGRRVVAMSRIIYDLENRGTLLSMELRYRPDDSWTVATGVDLLGSLKHDSPGGSSSQDYFEKNRANDRVHLGVTHAF